MLIYYSRLAVATVWSADLMGTAAIFQWTPRYISVMDTLIKFYSHQLMHFLIQICISLLSYNKIT